MSTEAAAHQIDRRLGAGLVIALISAATFGSSGTFAKSLLVTGWSSGAIVTMRITGAALVLLVPTLLVMRGRWHLLPHNLPKVVLYGGAAVAGCQLAYFNAVDHLSVGVALLLEYLAPVMIVGWVWLRHGRAPRPLTIAGVVLSLVGLVLVLDVLGGVRLDLVGVLWGLTAAVGLVIFFLVAGHDDGERDLPPLALAGGGLTVGALLLLLAGAVGVLPLERGADVAFVAGREIPWWAAIAELVIVAAAIAYVTGIAAARALGSTVASFVGLTEVLFAILIAWLLLGEVLGPVQLLGGVLIVAGVIAVQLDDARRGRAATRDGFEGVEGLGVDSGRGEGDGVDGDGVDEPDRTATATR